MIGVSGASLASAQAELEEKLPRVSLTVAQELFGVLSVLDGSAALRRALTDPARTAQDKSALATALMGGKVSAETESIVASLASSRWASARDLGDALETLAATVAVAVAERGSENGLSGLEQLENDLFEFIQVVGSNHELQRALSEPQAGDEAKTKLALTLVPQASETARLLIGQAVSSPRGVKPTVLLERFVELVALRQDRWIANVTVTRPLSAEQQQRLQTSLNGLYDRDLKMNVSVDHSLIGGVRVRVADEVVDASVVTRLGELRRQLAG